MQLRNSMVVKKILQRLHCLLLAHILLFVGYHMVIMRYVNDKDFNVETTESVSLINDNIIISVFIVYLYHVGRPKINRIKAAVF